MILYVHKYYQQSKLRTFERGLAVLHGYKLGKVLIGFKLSGVIVPTLYVSNFQCVCVNVCAGADPAFKFTGPRSDATEDYVPHAICPHAHFI